MRTNQEIVALIKELKDSKGYSMSELARRVDMAKSALSRYFNGTRQFPLNRVDDFAKALNVSSEYILGVSLDNNSESIVSKISEITVKLKPDRQEKVYKCAKHELEDQKEENKIIGFPERKRIIKGRSTAAGAPIDGDVQDSEAETTVVDREEIPRNADEIITIAGDSMEPFLMRGEQAFIEYTPWVENGTAAVVSIEDVGVTCKYVYVEGQDIRLVSENDAYDDMIYPCEEVRIIGKIL